MKKVALVTGASAGIGKATAKLFLQDGYIVYGAARRVDKMQDIASLGAKLLKMDVSDEELMIEGVKTIIKNEGRIDVLVNNAGFGSYGTVEDVTMEDARYQLDVNLFGLARLTQLVLPYMREQHFGKIVNITSIGGKIGMPLGGWYHASKFAVEGLSDSLRLEVKSFGIDVIVIEPGGIKTEWTGIATESMKRVSGDTAYKGLVQKTIPMFDEAEEKGSDPALIARLIKKAVTANKPKARYSAGYMAAPILFVKRWLGDAIFDKMIESRLK
ncbi:MAG TPA: oxidoreductase [Mucilaginibacter sp.]|jgi:NAD(P)-dependent dehydrogenase (short-subunit alcohol dehydrogenase family)|nr:oxidoreductase [Mucilaginibacter sp.]